MYGRYYKKRSPNFGRYKYGYKTRRFAGRGYRRRY